MKKTCFVFAIVFAVVNGVLTVPSFSLSTLFFEDFEGLELGPYVDENLPDLQPIDSSAVWTNTPPEGWEVENLTPVGGVTDWHGWTFANVQAWSFVAGDQRRSEFTKASGTAAIVDPDEWDDMDHEPGTFNSFLHSPPISLEGVAPSSIEIKFDSSWRPEDSQAAALTVSYDGGPPIDVFFWTSAEGDFYFHDDNSTNETLTFQLDNPDGASEMVLSFEMFEAGNDWWWAIDNIEITSEGTTLFTEDFEGLDLGPFVDENLPDNIQPLDVNAVWTNTPPEGWSVEDLTPTGGVTEWRTWAFSKLQAWASVAGDQRRFEFTKGTGTVAIADPDEWDDSSHEEGTYNTYLSSPSISLEGADPNSIILSFSSSWRPEDNQNANLTVTYDTGEEVELFFWSSTAGDPYFKDDDSTNETIEVEIDNPENAQSMVLTWGMINAGNDWWWAIDNVEISVPTSVNDWQLF